jgi:hypothetical protein
MMLDQGTRLLDHLKAASDPICKQKLRQEAIASLQRGMRTTPEMETNLISALRHVGVTVIVAPSEVDAQLAHLCLSGVCQAALSENFDLLLYSALSRCSFPLIFKFETTGASHVVSLKSLGCVEGLGLRTVVEIPLSLSQRGSGLKRQLSIRSTQSLQQACLNLSSLLQDPRLLLQLALLTGCEFLDPVRGMTLSTALQVLSLPYPHLSSRCQIVRLHRSHPADSRLVQIVRHLRTDEAYEVPAGYLERLLRAEALFSYHPVYDPLNKLLRPFLDPHLLTLGNPLSASQDPCAPPLIDQHELQKLSLEDALLERSPPLVSLSDLCEGNVSIHSYAPIVPRLPWDHPDLRPPPHLVHSKELRSRHGVWGTRLLLMKCLSPSLSSGSSSESQSSQESPPPFPSVGPAAVSLLNLFGASSLREPGRGRAHKRKSSSPEAEPPEGVLREGGALTPPGLKTLLSEVHHLLAYSSSTPPLCLAD